MSVIDDLLNFIFDDRGMPLYGEFEAWVRSSRRYRTFAAAYQTKIRAKLKAARDEDGLKDLRAELETAMLLLRDSRFMLEYEKYAALKQRGPDFTVIFKTHTPFNVEVRRIRGLEMNDTDSDARVGKLIAILCDKVGQMPPSIINLLWLITEEAVSLDDLTQAVTTLQRLAERKDEAFFRQRGFVNAADFLKQFRQLSGIVLHQPPGENVIWLNPMARHKTLPDIETAIRRLEAG